MDNYQLKMDEVKKVKDTETKKEPRNKGMDR